ncbi:MAG TPA: hypothetical protein VEL28_18310, partial [Candidatus Binatia bacterium]|nr:hypothetical protein [Candidatus Binatia bacterium]
ESSCTTGPTGGTEECDDGDTANDDSCVATCQVAECHDGFVCTDVSCSTGPTGAAEECDDGDTANDDFCVATCEVAECHDGFVCSDAGTCTTGPNGAVEECDDGDTDDTNSCVATCATAECHDGFLCTDVATCTTGPTGGIEECDDGDASNDDSCVATCKIAACHDGFQCTDGATCTTGPTGGTEECDDGDTANDDSCVATCETAECHDGFECTDVATCTTGPTGGIEACDDGDLENTDSCVATCQDAACHDGFLCTDAGTCTTGPTGGTEECDDGDANNDDSCVAACKIAACHDGFECTDVATCTTGPAGGIEECDDGDVENNDACVATCADAECHDGFLCTDNSTCVTGPSGGTEECDDGDVQNDDSCVATCKIAACHDGFVCTDAATCTSGPTDGTEECDDGDLLNSNGCVRDCELAECHDGLECTDPLTCATGPGNGPEECDDGNLVNTDPCVATCQDAECHDNFVCDGPGCNTGPTGGDEECDDGNQSNSDSCVKTCQLATCGDGVECDGPTCLVAPGFDEGCDDGEDNNGIGDGWCVKDCTRVQTCGDGEVDAAPNGTEECDDENEVSVDDSCTGTEDCVYDDPANPCVVACQDATCGDGYRNIEAVESAQNDVGIREGCDDANQNNGDGCLNNCRASDGEACAFDMDCGDTDCCKKSFCSGKTGDPEDRTGECVSVSDETATPLACSADGMPDPADCELGTEEDPSCVLGDANGDGTIVASDALAILRTAVGPISGQLECPLCACDIVAPRAGVGEESARFVCGDTAVDYSTIEATDALAGLVLAIRNTLVNSGFSGVCFRCADGSSGGGETDVDCGGALVGDPVFNENGSLSGGCPEQLCEIGKKCEVDTDCVADKKSGGEGEELQRCIADTCASCTDGKVQNDETDRFGGPSAKKECGGVCDQRCEVDKKCRVDDDCLVDELSKTNNGRCERDDIVNRLECASCDDGTRQDGEADFYGDTEDAGECGGICRKLCAPGDRCFENSDCEGLFDSDGDDVLDGGVCANGTCTAVTNFDIVLVGPLVGSNVVGHIEFTISDNGAVGLRCIQDSVPEAFECIARSDPNFQGVISCEDDDTVRVQFTSLTGFPPADESPSTTSPYSLTEENEAGKHVCRGLTGNPNLLEGLVANIEDIRDTFGRSLLNHEKLDAEAIKFVPVID